MFNINIKLTSSLFLIALFQQGLAQDSFSVYVAEYMTGDFSNTVPRCPATIITDRHVLTTAACATPTNSSFELAIQIYMSFGAIGGGTRTISAQPASIHPNYTGDAYSYNIAVVGMHGIFNTTLLPPRTLGSIPSTNTTCSLFGWGESSDNPETVDVVPHAPEYCYSNRSQAYCTEQVPPSKACQANRGSPLVCNPQSVDGILLENECTEDSGSGRFLQPYHSIGEFREWIESVSAAVLAVNQISTVLLLSALVICLKNAV